MQRNCLFLFVICLYFLSCANNQPKAVPAGDTTVAAAAGADTLMLSDVANDTSSPAGMEELSIPATTSLLHGFIYLANGNTPHPTLVLVHGYAGNERNLDLAQVARARGYNVVYFDYNGSWATQGTFSLANCVDDVVNVVAFCKKNATLYHIDTANIALFGHGLGGWVCLKALQKLPGVTKGFVTSTWDIPQSLRFVKGNIDTLKALMGHSFLLNSTLQQVVAPVIANPELYNLANDGKALALKQITMLDEHNRNAAIAGAIKKENTAFFEYAVWPTDHAFSNKRIALIKKVLAFLNR